MRRFYLAGMVCVCLLASQVHATPISSPVIDEATGQFPYTLYSLSGLSVVKGTQINGLIGTVGNVRLGKQTQVNEDIYTDGKLKAGRFSAVTGRLIAEGNIRLLSRSSVGRIDGGGTLRLGRNAEVLTTVALANYAGFQQHATSSTGPLLGVGLNETWDNSPFLAKPTFISDLAKPVVVGKNIEKELAPGTYGRLRLGNNATLVLTDGDYDFKSIQLGRNSKVILRTLTDQEAVNVKVATRMITSSKVEIERDGPGTSQFRVAGSTKIGHANTLFTSIVTHNQLRIGHHSELTGFFYSEGNMRLGKQVVVNAIDNPSPSVPEPATLTLLGLGTLGYLRKRAA